MVKSSNVRLVVQELRQRRLPELIEQWSADAWVDRLDSQTHWWHTLVFSKVKPTQARVWPLRVTSEDSWNYFDELPREAVNVRGNPAPSRQPNRSKSWI
jgi:hypothetical protein